MNIKNTVSDGKYGIIELIFDIRVNSLNFFYPLWAVCLYVRFKLPS